MSLLTIQGSVELGMIYAVMALGVFLSFRTLNTADLTVDGSFVLGSAVSAMMCLAGHPALGVMLAFAAGGLAGMLTSVLNTKLGIQPLLSGILVMLGLYSVNLRIMGGKPNIPLIKERTVFHFEGLAGLGGYQKLVTALLFLMAVILLLYFFLKTKFGLVLRATGDNENMVRASGTSTDFTKLAGLALANGLVGMSGALLAQYNKFADVNSGTGMVIIGLASVIIGEVVFGTKGLFRRLTAVALGSILYRLIIALALQLGMPATDLKLISAVIVTLALTASKLGGIFQKIFRNFSSSKESGVQKNA